MSQPPHPGPPPREPHQPSSPPGHQPPPQGHPTSGALQPHGRPVQGLPVHGLPVPGPPPGYARYGAVPGPHLAPVAYKDTTAAYLLWFFLGGVGAHKFYLRSPGLGALYLVLSVLGWATAWLLVGFLLLVPLAVLLVVDAFTMPERVRVVNASTHAINARFR